MRRLAILLLAPALLAPVRYQSGEDTIMLGAAQGPSKNAVELPSAAPLASPTVITLSPTLISPSAMAVTPTAAPVAPTPGNLMPETTAIICITALKTTSDIALLSYEQQRQPAIIKLTVAANVNANVAANRQYPNMADFTDAFNALRYNTPQKAQLATAVATAQGACANPHPGKVAPGTSIPVPRPN